LADFNVLAAADDALLKCVVTEVVFVFNCCFYRHWYFTR